MSLSWVGEEIETVALPRLSTTDHAPCLGDSRKTNEPVHASFDLSVRFRTALVPTPHKTGDGLGAVDFDVATNSQGLEVRRFTIKTLSRDASHASVVATLTPDNWVRKSERENEIRYDLVWERGRWAIDDIHSVIEPNAWSLRAILKQYLVR